MPGLVLFIVVTFAWTWAFYLPIAIGGHSPYEMPWLVLLILGGMGPSLVGIVSVLLGYSPEGRADYWRRAFSVRRIPAGIWLFILVVVPAIYGIALLVGALSSDVWPGAVKLWALMDNPLQAPFAVFISFMSGPWSEEFGWRGYAQDRIWSWGAIPGSALLGAVWGLWHLPLYFMAGTWHAQTGLGPAGFWTFMAGSVGLSLIMTWVWAKSGRSILSAMLLHFAANFTAQLLAPVPAGVEVMASLAMVVLGLALCMSMPAERRLAEQPLG